MASNVDLPSPGGAGINDCPHIASACHPPVKLSLADLVHRGSKIVGTRDRKLALVDGGVFNNLGTDWDLTQRNTVVAADYMVLHPSHSIPVATRIIVDASAESDIGPSRLASFPVIGSIHNEVFSATFS